MKRTIFIENGERVTRRVSQKDYIIEDGNHPAIIDHDTFMKAQARIALNPPRLKLNYGLKNPFSSLLYCAKCGKAMRLQHYSNASDRIGCPCQPRCYKSAIFTEVEKAVIVALEQIELPKLEAKISNGNDELIQIKNNLLKNLEKKLAEYRDQEEKQYELLEKGIYSEDVFERRHNEVEEKIADTKKLCRKKSIMKKKLLH